MRTKTEQIGDLWYVVIAGDNPPGIKGDPIGFGHTPFDAHKHLIDRIERESGIKVTTIRIRQ